MLQVRTHAVREDGDEVTDRQTQFEEDRPVKRKKGAPSKREIELVTAIRDAADDLTKANDYAEGYMARSALVRAMQALNDWAMKGRPHA